MSFKVNWTGSALVLATVAIFLSGCGAGQPDQGNPNVNPVKGAAAQAPDHSGWWCKEHGVPEGICAQCSTQLAADFQKKGDWCKEHNRPESQCFICHPELEDKFAAQYEAKFGGKPPARTDAYNHK